MRLALMCAVLLSAALAQRSTDTVKVVNTWDGGWQGNIELSAGRTYNGWTIHIEFERPVQKFEIWAAKFTTSDNKKFVLTNQPFNAFLAQGGIFKEAFVIRTSGPNPSASAWFADQPGGSGSTRRTDPPATRPPTIVSTAAPVYRATSSCSSRLKSTVTSTSVREASGLCASRNNKGVLFTHNDSGGTNRIFAINAATGQVIAKLTIDGASHHDWEDIACQNGYIYIGDIGGNIWNPARTIYKVKEPAQGQLWDRTLRIEGKLRYAWDEKNSETLMVDATNRIYLVSKRGFIGRAIVYRFPDNVQFNDATVRPYKITTLQGEGSDQVPGPVGGDISSDNKRIIMKSYNKVYLWKVGSDGSFTNALKRRPEVLPHHWQGMSEAVCFDVGSRGFYTLPEGGSPRMYFTECRWAS